MSKAAMAAGVLGALFGVGAFVMVMNASPEKQTSTEDVAAAQTVENDVAQLRKDLASQQNAVRALDRESGKLLEKLLAAEARITALETAQPVAASGVADEASDKSPEELAAEKAKRMAEMQALQDKIFSGKATADEQQRFWKLARTSGVVDEMMSSLEKKVKESPYDNEMRMQLSQAYVAKLLSIPGGPEQGVWAMKAQGQWEKIIEREPDHWDARYSLAFSFSQYPEFLNKTPDAIKGFEKVREIQERNSPEAKHSGTYLQLSMLYRRQGNNKKAREVLKAGAERHPDDKGLAKALESMGEESEF